RRPRSRSWRGASGRELGLPGHDVGLLEDGPADEQVAGLDLVAARAGGERRGACPGRRGEHPCGGQDCDECGQAGSVTHWLYLSCRETPDIESALVVRQPSTR